MRRQPGSTWSNLERRMAGHGEKMGRKKEQAIAALLSERSIAAAAAKAGIGCSTLKLWLRDESFRRDYSTARRDALEQAMSRLSELGGKAAQTFDELLDSESEAIRLQAARSVMEFCPEQLRENLPTVLEPRGPDYGQMALADPISAGLVVQLLSRAAARQPVAVECVVQPVSPVSPAASGEQNCSPEPQDPTDSPEGR
jgi:hypothetical protein